MDGILILVACATDNRAVLDGDGLSLEEVVGSGGLALSVRGCLALRSSLGRRNPRRIAEDQDAAMMMMMVVVERGQSSFDHGDPSWTQFEDNEETTIDKRLQRNPSLREVTS